MIKECENYVKMWEARCYSEGIPDDVPSEMFDRVPSYRLIAKAILSNNVELLGVIKKPCAAYIRLKRIELEKRNPEQVAQLQMF